MSKKIFTLAITVDGQKYDGGQEVETDDLPEGSVTSMVRLGQLVDPEEWEELNAPKAAANPLELVDADWLGTKVTDAALSPHIQESLVAAKLQTAGKIVAYGEKHGSLDGITGIGEASEIKIQEWLASLKKSQ